MELSAHELFLQHGGVRHQREVAHQSGDHRPGPGERVHDVHAGAGETARPARQLADLPFGGPAEVVDQLHRRICDAHPSDLVGERFAEELVVQAADQLLPGSRAPEPPHVSLDVAVDRLESLDFVAHAVRVEQVHRLLQRHRGGRLLVVSLGAEQGDEDPPADLVLREHRDGRLEVDAAVRGVAQVGNEAVDDLADFAFSLVQVRDPRPEVLVRVGRRLAPVLPEAS